GRRPRYVHRAYQRAAVLDVIDLRVVNGVGREHAAAQPDDALALALHVPGQLHARLNVVPVGGVVVGAQPEGFLHHGVVGAR
nr:hypothetical protein [Tanacetum cinerariifolium]